MTQNLSRYVYYGLKIHFGINIAALPCTILMIPLNIITGVRCRDESGNIVVNGVVTSTTTTKFERIIQGQGVWPWGLIGLAIPVPNTYLFNLRIYASTIAAYPLAIEHLIIKWKK